MMAMGVDTSTAEGSVAVVEGERVLGEINIAAGGQHQSRLLRSVDVLLDLTGLEISKIDVLAVALGPGTFTGLRVGIATAKGMAVARGIPTYGISTLAAMAMRHREAEVPIVPMIDAGREEIYGALFSIQGGGLVPGVAERESKPEVFLRALPAGPVLFCGDGAVRYGGLIEKIRGGADRVDCGPSFLGSTLARWGVRMLQERAPWSLGSLRPNYIRPPDAEGGRRV